MKGFPGDLAVKNLPATQEPQERWVQSPGPEDLLEEEMATHSSILIWRIPWTEDPDGLQSMRSQRCRNNLSNLACMHLSCNDSNTKLIDTSITSYSYFVFVHVRMLYIYSLSKFQVHNEVLLTLATMLDIKSSESVFTL